MPPLPPGSAGPAAPSRRSRRGAASAIVRSSRSASAISCLLALREARDRQHAPAGALRHLPVQLVGGRDQPREGGDELVAARGRQRQVGLDTQALDGLLRYGRVLLHRFWLLLWRGGSSQTPRYSATTPRAVRAS